MTDIHYPKGHRFIVMFAYSVYRLMDYARQPTTCYAAKQDDQTRD